jgi:uncharacterized membrane protein
VYKLALERGYSLSTMVGVALVAIVLAGIFYWRAFRMLRRGQWQILFALRVMAILLIVLLLFRPLLSYEKESEFKRKVIFLLDTSGSMSIADGASGTSRFNQARSQLEKWWPKVKGDFIPYLLPFAEVPMGEPSAEIEPLAKLAADGKATSLTRAIAAAAKQFPSKEVEAIIMLSDGINNSAGDPAEAAMKTGGIPVHAVGVGASLRSDVTYRDVQVTGIDCPDRLLLNNKAKITGSVDAAGLGGRVVRVVLEDDGQPLQDSELTLDDIEGAQKVEFQFTPTRKGRHTFTVRVPPLPEERITENNHRSALTTVVEPGIRVLYMEGTLRGEFGAIADRFLAKDPDLEFYALAQSRTNVFVKRTNIRDLNFDGFPKDAESINKFDVFILGDLDSSYLKPRQQELIVERVQNGAGLAMLGGYRSLGPGGYDGTPLGDALPVLLGGREAGQITDPFLPVLTPDGVRHPIFANIAGFFPTKSSEPKLLGLPPLLGATRVAAPRPDATLLAILPTELGGGPVLAWHTVGKGRSLVFCGDTTRAWQQGMRAMGQDSPFLRFWGQMVRFLAGRSADVEAKAGITGTSDKAHYEPEEVVRMSAVVRDEHGEGAADAKVVAKLKEPGGQTTEVQLTAVPGPSGHYAAQFEPKGSGTYELALEARIREQSVAAPDKIRFEVGRPNLEFEKLDMNEKLMMKIASNGSGRYKHLSTAGDFIDQLNRSQHKKREYFTKPLFNPVWCWSLFVGLVTVEWILRRRFQLR